MGQLLLFALAAFTVGMSKGGLAAASALAVPLLSIWMEPLVAAAYVLPVYLVSDMVGVYLFRRDFSLPNLKVLIPAGLVGVIIATLIAPWLSGSVAKIATGMIGLVYIAQTLIRARKGPVPPRPFDPLRGWFWGAMTGITSFIAHIGSPPFQTFMLPQQLPKLVFAGTTTITFTAINIFKLPAYGAIGLMEGFEWRTFAWMAVVAAIGAVVGRKLTEVLPDKIYMTFIQVMLFLVSVYLVAQGVKDWI